ncbi:MAG: deoxyguanosinetriphosphate triphosphohydrolase [Candidatus Firestonebacteria bacterium]
MLLTREKLEDDEEKFLESYGVKSKFSKGRKIKEPEHPYRTCFQRDRDRIVHSNAFRRLEYKTQVFVIHENDYYRTRLTHTIEVTQIARTIAKALRLNEDLVEAIALAHDLGHTPFGHSGEEKLNKLMKKYGGFEHNKQSLRIVDELEERYPEFSGLNLTYEVREGLAKHKTDFDNSLSKEFKTRFPSLEARVVNLADEIAYCSHDLDDGIKSNLIKIDDVDKLEICKEISQKLSNLSFEKRRYLLVRNIINTLSTDLINETVKNLKIYKIKSVNDVRNVNKPIVSFSSVMIKKKKELREFLFKNLYKHYKVVRMEVKAHKILEDLFNTYLKNFNKILPSDLLEKIKKYYKEQIVCDFIAGMTDRYALEEHKKLFDPTERV